MTRWFSPVLGLLALADAVGAIVVALRWLPLPAPLGGPPWPPPAAAYGEILPFLVSLVLVLIGWWCAAAIREPSSPAEAGPPRRRFAGLARLRGRRRVEAEPARPPGAGWMLAAHAALAVAAVLTLSGFASGPWRGRAGSVVILAVNDVYRIEGIEGGKAGGLARLRTVRAELERAHGGRVLLLHAGDAIFPSFASRMYDGRQMIDVLNLMDGDPTPGRLDERMFAVFGNHEFDREDCAHDSVLQKRVAESDFHWLHANMALTPCAGGPPRLLGANLASTKIVEVGGLRVGLFGLTIDPKRRGLSFQFMDARATARVLVADLRRRGAEVVIALTHLNQSDDLRLYHDLRDEGLDLIVGGHDHVHMALPKGAPEPRIFKADADAVTAWQLALTRHTDGRLTVTPRLRELREGVPKDPAVDGVVAAWTRAHAAAFCKAAAADPDRVGATPDPLRCLDERLGVTETAFVASEERIRSSETSAGNWVTDEMAAAFRECGVDGAVINAGGLRLNYDVPAKSLLTRRHLEELIQFPTTLRVYRLTHADFRRALRNAISEPGAGRWLQVSEQIAFIYRPDPSGQGGPGGLGPVAVRPPGKPPINVTESSTGSLRIVVNEYLQKDSTDGYDEILRAPEPTACDAAGRDLKALLYRALQRQDRIKPEEQGRICTEAESRERPCRAAEWVRSR